MARACGSFSKEGGPCSGLASYPNKSIPDYGSVSGADATVKEFYHRGPISGGFDAMPRLKYGSGIMKTKGDSVDPVISAVRHLGWGIQMNTITCSAAISTCEKREEWARSVEPHGMGQHPDRHHHVQSRHQRL